MKKPSGKYPTDKGSKRWPDPRKIKTGTKDPDVE